MDFRKIKEKTAQKSRALLNEITPKERKSLIVIVLLFIIGAVVKNLRGV
ncbi:MAG: hypothetical protein PF904_15875 [Kiritimatiellae bacterium]|jgi:hypothetical protein|nr:hypothetical protein [Kiritimatiellia bacterium]